MAGDRVKGSRSYFGKDTETYKDSMCANCGEAKSTQKSVFCNTCYKEFELRNSRLRARMLEHYYKKGRAMKDGLCTTS